MNMIVCCACHRIACRRLGFGRGLRVGVRVSQQTRDIEERHETSLRIENMEKVSKCVDHEYIDETTKRRSGAGKKKMVFCGVLTFVAQSFNCNALPVVNSNADTDCIQVFLPIRFGVWTSARSKH
jgi:hypothetical protein